MPSRFQKPDCMHDPLSFLGYNYKFEIEASARVGVVQLYGTCRFEQQLNNANVPQISDRAKSILSRDKKFNGSLHLFKIGENRAIFEVSLN